MTWEQRYHPLRDEWVVLAGHRQRRPWQGERQGARVAETPTHVADCYLCPGNARVHGARNRRAPRAIATPSGSACAPW